MEHRNKPNVLGIPDLSKKSTIPTLAEKEWEFAVHEHHAKRAGLHYDLRLGDPTRQKAYS
jgi:hypothetical protein